MSEDPNLVFVILMPDESLSLSFIDIRKLVEGGVEVIAGTPNAMTMVTTMMSEKEE